MYKSLCLFLIVVTFNFSYAQNNDAKVINKALVKAKQENKHVFINYLSASSKLSEKMKKQMKNDDFKPLFNSNYVVVNIIIPKEETSEYFNCSNPIKSMGENNCDQMKFPFWCILDNSGNYIATSLRDDKNIGYPTTKEGVDEFIEVIRNTSQLTEVKLNVIANSFHNTNNKELLSAKD